MLKARQFNQLHELLVKHFDEGDIKKLIAFNFDDIRFNHVVGNGLSLNDACTKLIESFERLGLTYELVQAAARERQRVEDFKELAAQLGDMAPSPDAEPEADAAADIALPMEMDDGPVRIHSNFYIQRPADSEALDILRAKSETLGIRGYRKSGKTSLLYRIRAWAEEQEFAATLVSFRIFDRDTVKSTDRLFFSVAYEIASKLKLEVDVDEHWSDRLGAIQNLSRFIEFQLLPKQIGRASCRERV